MNSASISFRDKQKGWKLYSFVVKSAPDDSVVVNEPLSKNFFMQGFLKDLYLRPSCHACPAKSGKSGSDITIADYWGIAKYYPTFDDNRGVSLVLINTLKGAASYNTLKTEQIQTTYAQALWGNPSMERSVKIPKQRDKFWSLYKQHGVKVIAPICKSMRPTLIQKIIFIMKRIVIRLIRRK